MCKNITCLEEETRRLIQVKATSCTKTKARKTVSEDKREGERKRENKPNQQVKKEVAKLQAIYILEVSNW